MRVASFIATIYKPEKFILPVNVNTKRVQTPAIALCHAMHPWHYKAGLHCSRIIYRHSAEHLCLYNMFLIITG
jgi:hypothetical protein